MERVHGRPGKRQQATERRRIRRTRDALLDGADGRGSAEREAPAAQRLREAARPWLSDPNIQGFSIAYRTKNGRKTGELVLKVYVDRKLPAAEVRHLIPAEVRLSPRHKPVRTDVEGVGAFTRQANLGRFRPALPGSGLSLLHGHAGTFGCLVRKKDDPGRLFILGSAHVLAEGNPPIGSEIYQPATRELTAPSPDDIVARLSEVYPSEATADGFPNLAEAAIAEVVSPALVSSAMIHWGVPKGTKFFLQIGDVVKMTGYQTNAAQSKIESADFCRADIIDGKRYGYRELVICESPMSQPGDSGAAVLSEDDKVVGILLGSFENKSVFSRIRPILEAFDADLATDP
jgi:hypothetical protein